MSEEARAQEEREETERLVQQALHFGGMSTDPEVKRLREQYPAAMLQPGFTIHYDDISTIIGVEYGQTRWDTVVDAWRRKIEKEDNVVLLPERGLRRFRVASPEDRVRDGLCAWGEIRRKLKRRSLRVARADVEGEALTATRGHFLRYSAMVVNQLQAGQKALPAPPSANRPTQRA
jgi:hypothetical protein